ncbi:MAG: glycosyltransferase family 4 protein [bacterium]
MNSSPDNKTNAKKILLVTADFPPMVGGQSSYLWELWTRLPAANIRIIAPSPRTDDAVESRILRTWLPSGHCLVSRIVKTLLLAVKSLRQCMKEKPDMLVSGQATAGGVAAWLAGKIMNVPYCLTIHGGDVLGWGGPRRILARMLNEAAKLIVNSTPTGELVFEMFGGHLRPKTAVINPPVPAKFLDKLPARDRARAELGLGPEDMVALTVARLHERKGIDLVLRAMTCVGKNGPGFVYIIVGDGPEKSRMEKLAAELGLRSPTVRFEGAVPPEKLFLYYAASDLFVLTPLRTADDIEGFGVVYLEAQAAGLPVIASRSGGVTDAVKDGETGTLIEPGNETALSEALNRLMLNPEERRKIGARGYERMRESFTPEAAVRKLEAALSSIPGCGPGGAS